jgi:phage-related tail fiber protein
VTQRMSDNQRKALDALDEAGGALGYAVWRDVSGVPKGSFARVRRALLVKELVVQEGNTYRPVSVTDATTDTSGTADGEESRIHKPDTLDAGISPHPPGKVLYMNERGDVWYEDA